MAGWIPRSQGKRLQWLAKGRSTASAQSAGWCARKVLFLAIPTAAVQQPQGRGKLARNGGRLWNTPLPCGPTYRAWPPSFVAFALCCHCEGACCFMKERKGMQSTEEEHLDKQWRNSRQFPSWSPLSGRSSVTDTPIMSGQWPDSVASVEFPNYRRSGKELPPRRLSMSSRFWRTSRRMSEN